MLSCTAQSSSIGRNRLCWSLTAVGPDVPEHVYSLVALFHYFSEDRRVHLSMLLCVCSWKTFMHWILTGWAEAMMVVLGVVPAQMRFSSQWLLSLQGGQAESMVLTQFGGTGLYLANIILWNKTLLLADRVVTGSWTELHRLPDHRQFWAFLEAWF